MRGVEQIPLVYDALMAVTDRIGLWKLRAWVTAGASGHILEVGCGTGRNLPRYPRGVRGAGIDPSLEARWQDFIQPAWTRVTGGCHPNRDTEGAVRRAGFRVDERRSNRNLRRLVARKSP